MTITLKIWWRNTTWSLMKIIKAKQDFGITFSFKPSLLKMISFMVLLIRIRGWVLLKRERLRKPSTQRPVADGSTHVKVKAAGKPKTNRLDLQSSRLIPPTNSWNFQLVDYLQCTSRLIATVSPLTLIISRLVLSPTYFLILLGVCFWVQLGFQLFHFSFIWFVVYMGFLNVLEFFL